MAITTTISRTTVQGDNRVVFGKSVLSGAASTGDVVTGLNTVEFFSAIADDTTPSYIAVDEVFPLASGDVSIKASGNDKTFFWKAEGK
jgi:hypothetical protein